MDDEMKEPNSEQTPSASDEQKPNIEGKQVSDGADDTTSPDDRSSNEDGATCNKEEDDLLLTSAINKLGGNKRAAIATAAIVAVIFCLPMLFPQMFCTHKLWTNANCTSPRTCKSCAKPRGNRSDMNGKKQHARFRRPVNAAAKPKGNPLGINQVLGLPKSITLTPPRRKFENAGDAERSLTPATKRKLLPFLATDRFQFHLKALLNDLTRNSPIFPIAAV